MALSEHTLMLLIRQRKPEKSSSEVPKGSYRDFLIVTGFWLTV